MMFTTERIQRIQRLLALSVLAAVFIGIVQYVGMAFAVADGGTGTEPVTINLAGLVGILLNIVAPILVGLFTKMTTHPGIKAVALLLISAITGVLTQFIASGGDGFPWADAFLTAFLSFVVAVASHFGFWRPTGVTAAAQRSVVK